MTKSEGSRSQPSQFLGLVEFAQLMRMKLNLTYDIQLDVVVHRRTLGIVNPANISMKICFSSSIISAAIEFFLELSAIDVISPTPIE